MSSNLEHFLCRFKLLIDFKHKALIAACKQNYPDLDGRGAIFIMVPIEGFSDRWMSDFLENPLCNHINKSRIRSAIAGVSEETAVLIERDIDSYNPHEQLLFCLVNNEAGGESSVTIARID